MYSDDDTHRWVGCPIRISTDQSLLAAPHGFSQRATSFVASWCQGIHRMPLSRSKPPHTHRNHPHPRIVRYFYCAGRLTPLSALPVLTAQRPLRSGSRQERHATQHSEVSNNPHGLQTRPERARSSRTHSAFSRRSCPHHHDHRVRQPDHGHEQKRTNLFTLTKNIALHRQQPARIPPDLLASRDNHPPPQQHASTPTGGGGRNRTDDPLLAKQVLCQLSYAPQPDPRPEPDSRSDQAQAADGGPGRTRTSDPTLIKRVL